MIRKIDCALAALIVFPAQAAPLGFDDVAAIVYADSKVAFSGMRVDAYIPDASLAESVGKFIDIPGGQSPVLFGPYAMIRWLSAPKLHREGGGYREYSHPDYCCGGALQLRVPLYRARRERRRGYGAPLQQAASPALQR